ncbi:hypothetical protein JR316_0010323 [Psilocybe cubensis]|uniref:Uncharacterized protein n=1 Tax=Psilocybe cubensis TaxID=181762 RepID=A0ACB8GSX0_PSICU|nr:hypothetical protein JR316_0010323 [Psilocybe cubensis]KAH9478085.1 hypothetical protein JR316_0010323 [Psilocybe cubensis]
MSYTSASVISPLLQELFHGLFIIDFAKCTQLSALMIVLYDYAITFEQEMSYLWKTRFNFVKVLFLLNRYYILISAIVIICLLNAAQLSTLSCVHYMLWQIWSIIVTSTLTQAILQARLYGLYSKNKKILAIMIPLYVLSIIAAVVLVVKSTGEVTAAHEIIAFPINRGHYCIVTSIPRFSLAYWIPGFAFELLLCALAIKKAFGHFKLYGSYYTTGVRIVDVLVGDSIVYFLVIAMVYVSCIAIWIADLERIDTPLGFELTISSTLCSRMVFNMHGALDKRDINQTIDSDETD